MRQCRTSSRKNPPHLRTREWPLTEDSLGVTGYIGGDAFVTINQQHPEYEWTFLVRNPESVAALPKQYPNAKAVHGDLDSYDLIVEEASKADVVFSESTPLASPRLPSCRTAPLTTPHPPADWADADHPGAATAIAAGLKRRATPAFLIHTSGAGILTVTDIHNAAFGTESSTLYDDWDGVSAVTSLPDDAAHRDVDKIVLAASAESPPIRTAIVCPPCIYGEGRGPAKRRSIQVPRLVRCALQRGKGFRLGGGRNRWRNVHVADLSNVYLRLVEEAAKPDGGCATWGAEGYYFAESGEHYWGDVAAAVAREACRAGLFKTAEVDELGLDEVDAMDGRGRYLWGTNSRHVAVRAKKVLGWQLTGLPSLEAEIPRAVEAEAEDMKLI
ncbi:hypothetical protein SLS55_001380 [Diplodia seriata]|uniref:NAD-dependent epimerase/dehydratase domain-containing protein n=1 Tax=Diplodia seriata TaxID=420778 RepID=A0ABR3CWW9_9PEZI